MPNDPRPEADDVENTEDESILRKDKWNYAFLVVLYVLQGIFDGLLDAIPIILQENGISYQKQAILSVTWLTMWCKLCMAPLIECIYNSRIGKRKSWLIPGQYLLGSMMLFSSVYIDTWVGEKDKLPSIIPIAITRLFSKFLLTILDMVLDSWALTMLQRENIAYQSICNIIGLKVGRLLGHDIFILLRSKEISNYLGQTSSILSFSGCFYFWSIVLLISNTMVWIFKKDASLDLMDEKDKKLSIVKSYKLIWDVLKLKPVRKFCIILFINKTAVAPIASLTMLKLIRGGLTSYKMVLMSMPFIPLQAILPFLFRRYFRGSRNLMRYARGLIYMIPIGFLNAGLIFFMPDMKMDGQLTTTFYVTYFVLHGIGHMLHFLLFSGYLSFLARITDPKYGAVYMTLINSISMAGHIWPSQLAKIFVEPLTFNVNIDESGKLLQIDGYYIIILIGSVLNICFLYFGGLKAMMELQELDERHWRIQTKENDECIMMGEDSFGKG